MTCILVIPEKVRDGQAGALVESRTKYAHLKETLAVLSDPHMMQQGAESRAFYGSGRKGLAFEAVVGEFLIFPDKGRPTHVHPKRIAYTTKHVWRAVFPVDDRPITLE